MTIVVVFVVVAVATSYVFLWRNNITEKSWIADGPATDISNERDLLGSLSAKKATKSVALMFFLAVVTSLFALFVSAYFMRMELADWQPVPDPSLLWFNTFTLVLASTGIQWASYSASRNQPRVTKFAMLATGILTFAFIIGQLWAWQLLVNQGYYLTSNPAAAFFYLITGLHGLHILGGLWVWCRTSLRLFSGIALFEVLSSVELCRTYWHFLLIIWLGLFGLLLST